MVWTPLGSLQGSALADEAQGAGLRVTAEGDRRAPGSPAGEPASRRPAEPSGEGAETGPPGPWAGAESHLGGARLMEVASGWPAR